MLEKEDDVEIVALLIFQPGFIVITRELDVKLYEPITELPCVISPVPVT